jgi:regulator of protease activity HflC (stomatin/prohibitin superfamily)
MHIAMLSWRYNSFNHTLEDAMNIADVVRTLAGFAWLGAVGLGILMFTRAARNQPARGIGTLTLGVLVIAVVFTLLGAGLVFINPEERGVVISALTDQGYRPEPLTPGLHWVVPFAERVQRYTISRQTYTMSVATQEGQVQGDDSIRARTKDGQEVFIDASIIYSVDPNQLIPLHINWQTRYEDQVVRPAARNAIRDAVSQYGVEEIVSTKRAEMEDLIAQAITKKFAQNDLAMVDFLLRDIHFSDEYAAAVEQKQIAEQQAQQAKLVVEQRKQEAEQARQVAQGQADAAVIAARGAAEARIIQAEAEAKANQLLAQSLTPALVQYQYILKLAPGVQTIFVPSGNQFILPLPGSSEAPPPATTP